MSPLLWTEDFFFFHLWMCEGVFFDAAQRRRLLLTRGEDFGMQS